MSLIIEPLIFNAFQVNTYFVYAENKECLVVDAACYDRDEQKQLSTFIEQHNLKPVRHINTHCHVDHVLGNSFLFHTYGIKPEIHIDALYHLEPLVDHAATFGFEIDEVVYPDKYLDDGQKISIGGHEIEILHTPGHAAGSVCLKHDADRWVITGDLIFHGSIGRTDLPSGNLETLLNSIHEKIFVLEDDFKLYPGHGHPTSVGFERNNNPFL